ncbi:FKBP-type peptidyl-prolyl cis-trans isomerase [Taibaiella soli]|nr:FKBP-type peptidyl-prolyl cis-trans isomerase [Taibaiella soli]
MAKKLLTAAALLSLAIPAGAQAKKEAPKKVPAAAAYKTPAGFKTTKDGLEYKIVKDAPGTQLAKVGDFMEVHIHTHIGDSILFDSRKMNNNQPVPFQVPAPAFKGDLSDGLVMLTEGDSAIFRVPLDSLLKMGSQPMPWMKKGENMHVEYDIQVVSVKTPEQQKAEAEAHAKAQINADDKALQDYFAKNNLKPQKTASGLYYVITNPGTGDNPKPGQQVTVNYTGMTMSGAKFDSNVDPQFKHVEPFSFALGQGQVIRGWDEGIALLKKGGKGTLYIPSGLAYGERSPSPLIPANSVLIFDVEVKDFK